jgi:hypothetical protein
VGAGVLAVLACMQAKQSPDRMHPGAVEVNVQVSFRLY